MTFTLAIELGNDAMSAGCDVAEALRNVAQMVRDSELDFATNNMIVDLNGNVVGSWEVR